MTGQYPARLGVTNFIEWGGSRDTPRGALIDAPYVDHLSPTHGSIGTMFRDVGYQTWHVGKWHLGSEAYWPDKHGFDVNLGGCHAGMLEQGYFAPWGLPTLPEPEPGTYMTDHLTDVAIDRIASRDPGRPFFLNLWYYTVHIPIEAPKDLIDKYRRKASDLGLDAQSPFELGDFMPTIAHKDQRIKRRVIQSDPGYAAMVERMDWNIGRLMGFLDATDNLRNTILVFTSDNGGLSTAEGSPTSNLPLTEGKGWTYEGGLRIPLIIRGPGIDGCGRVSRQIVSSPDFVPTFAELAGIGSPTSAADGRSFAPALHGLDTEPEADDRPVFWHYPHYGNQGGTPGAAIRRGNYKLIEFFEDEHLELYQLADDPGEHRNLASELKELTEYLHFELRKWISDMEAPIPTRNPDFRQWDGRVRPGRMPTTGIELI